ncbi:antitoxin VapB family protein [Methanoculleus frigidifontis]|uniref:antitoxin VapB family protein n=1 Tax=Methanoculleus frigidifontis TaxID=2584085 RepID=UPI002658C8AA|nr:antitoxin VapB family protein [Methanoculleus sp. FWC-SCC1]
MLPEGLRGNTPQKAIYTHTYTYTGTGTRTISISDDAYERLSRLKGPSKMSFSEVILKYTPLRRNSRRSSRRSGRIPDWPMQSKKPHAR